MNWSSVLANKHFIHGVDKMVKHFGRLDPFEIESSILPCVPSTKGTLT